jgi:alpha-galactosidase
MCYPASSMGAHVSANKRTGIETKAAVAMAGTFGYELDPKHMSCEDKEKVKEQIKNYHRFYNVIHFGDLYRITAPTDDEYKCAWQYNSKDKSEALLTVVIKNRTPHDFLLVKLKGLDPEKLYLDEDSGEIYSGGLLMNVGINLTDGNLNAGRSFVKYFTEVK